jgi:hypothetical protein
MVCVCVYILLRSDHRQNCNGGRQKFLDGSFGSRTARCLCDAPQQAGGMVSWVTRSRATGTSICVAATKTVKILSLSLSLSFHQGWCLVVQYFS